VEIRSIAFTSRFAAKRALSIGMLVAGFAAQSFLAQTTAFNFQGRLNDGTNPANGRYDLQFKLFDAITGGTQTAPTLDRPNTMLVNGVFSTPLDFGAGAFAGGSRFLEISVRPFNSPSGYVILGARQQVLSVPFAVRAASAANADNAVNAVNAQNAVSATSATTASNAVTAQNSLSLGGLAAGNYAQLNTVNKGTLAASALGTTGTLAVLGNTVQTNPAYGLPKAMLYVDSLSNPAQIRRCYNGVTGSSAGNCGFTVSEALGHGVGVYHINLGFPVTDRFISLAVQNAGSPLFNVGANFRFNAGNLEVFTFVTNNDDNNTVGRDFMVIVY
jgi:hypothetical protein